MPPILRVNFVAFGAIGGGKHTSDTGDGFTARKIGDMNEGIVE